MDDSEVNTRESGSGVRRTDPTPGPSPKQGGERTPPPRRREGVGGWGLPVAMPGDTPDSLNSSNPSGKAARVRAMFGRIVPRYDLMNTLMTGGMDRRWRRIAVDTCQPRGAVALDIATGTGELALEMVRQGARRVVGLDFCGPMLAEAARKTGALRPTVQLAAGDALALPFPDGSFDRVISGFLLRNLADLPRGLQEMARVLKPGGRAVCLEITHPPSRLFRTLFIPFFYRFVPVLGAAVAGDPQAYCYLPNSLTHFPDAPRLAEMMRRAGFREVSYRYLSLGAVAVHVGVKASVDKGYRGGVLASGMESRTAAF